MRPLKIGDKVRHRNSDMEGIVAYSSFGLSINGFTYNESHGLVHFKTLGETRSVVEQYWKRVYKWKHDMLRYENERDTKNAKSSNTT